MNWASPYESATRCTSGPEPGARALLAWALETYRGQGAYSLGIYNCRNVAGSNTTSTHGEGRAVDVALPMVGGRGTPLGHSIVRRIGEHGVRLGVQAIVYDRRVWSARSPSGRAYTGVHPHYDHLHIELTRHAARVLTLATFRAVLGTQEDGQMLTRGSKGHAVRLHQQALQAWNAGALPNFGADADYGAETETWVRQYQQAAQIEPTGSIDGLTSALLLRFLTSAGFTKTQADGLYAPRSHGHAHTHTVPKTGSAG